MLLFSWSCKAARFPIKSEGDLGPRSLRKGDIDWRKMIETRPEAEHEKRNNTVKVIRRQLGVGAYSVKEEVTREMKDTWLIIAILMLVYN